MVLVTIVGIVVLLFFSVVLLVGAPYLPTLKKQQEEALNLLSLNADQLLIELGSGDGRVLKAAAQRGIRAIGYELNPLLVVYSKIVCWPERRLIKIKWRNFWDISIEPADGIYVFLLDRYMKRLDKKITAETRHSVKVVSYTFEIPGRKPLSRTNGMMLYSYNPLSSSGK